MGSKKLKLVIGSSLILVLLFLGLYSFGDIKYSAKEGLSYSEKKRDAEYLMNTLQDTYLYFDEIKADGGQDFLREKKKIIASIAKTASDEEFYAQLSNLFRKFTYGYLSMAGGDYPSSYDYHYLDKNLGLTKETYRDKFKEGKLKWDPIHKSYSTSLSSGYFACNLMSLYFHGEYYVVMSQDPEVHIGDKLIAVDGIPVDEYAKNYPNDKYLKSYDYNYDKYKVSSLLTFMDKDIKEIVIKKNTGEEIKVQLLPFDESKPILESVFQESESDAYIDPRERNKGNFLNYIEKDNILALNFSKYDDAFTYFNDLNKNQQLFSSISESNYLILDLRQGVDANNLLEVLNFISPKNIEYSDYKIIKKSEINVEYNEYFRDKFAYNLTEITNPIESLEKHYPLSEYYIFKDRKFEFSGNGKFKGKVFILFDSSHGSDRSIEILNALIENNLATVISDGKFTSPNYESMGFNINFILPNSNLPITSNVVKVVDEEGVVIEKKIVTPQIILKKDTSKTIKNFREEIFYRDYQKEDELYTDVDEYYKEVIKLIE